MKYSVRQEDNGRTHIDWVLDKSVTAEMVDWHWSNMDKTFILWHPSDHYGFEWYIPVTPETFTGAIHYTLQTRGGRQDMTMEQCREMGLGLAYIDPATLAPEVAEYIIYKHACIVGARKHGKIDPNFNSIRIHQWEEREEGLVGMVSAIMFPPYDVEKEKQRMLDWTPHAAMEIGNFENFLPQLFNIWKAVDNPRINPYHDLTIAHNEDGTVYYPNI